MGSRYDALRRLLAEHEDWLMQRVLDYARQRHYTRYTSTLLEAWRVSIAGLSASLIAACERSDGPPELGPDEDYQSDPVAAFGILEAKRHRDRGVTVAMFLGLLKYYRQAYRDLIDRAKPAEREEWHAFVDRCFDRVEIGFCAEWVALKAPEAMSALQDASRRMTNEKNKYLTIFESLQSPAFFVSPGGQIEIVNHAGMALIKGRAVPGETHYGHRTRLAVPPWLREILEAFAAEGATEQTIERDIPLKDEARHFTVRLKRMLDVSEKFDGTMVLLDDITPVRQANEQLRERNEVLKQQRDQLRAMASALTLAEQKERTRLAELLHGDLQQLLVGARYGLARLRASPDLGAREIAEESDALLKQAIESARSLSGELGPPILHEGGFVPALEWLRGWMKRCDLVTELHVDENAVPASDDLAIILFQSVKELLVNTVKHSQVKTASVDVRRVDGFVRVGVSDPGVGMKELPKAIAGGQAGFGLAAMRERITMLGGKVEIETAPGKGTRVTLIAPARPVPGKPEAAVASPSSAGKASPAGRPDRIRVLVAEDHAVVRQGLIRVLAEEPDIEVVGEVSDGKQAVEAARSLHPDVITMDISMPVMDGLEATRAIHAELPEVRIIGLSMYEDRERSSAMKAAGAMAYVSKSAPSDVLVATVRACGGLGAEPHQAASKASRRPSRARSPKRNGSERAR